MKKAVIFGITGQDGSYLAEMLLKKNYEVHGVIRRSSSFNTGRIHHIFQENGTPNQTLFLHYGDLTDNQSITKTLLAVHPDEIYNLGAQSHVRVSFDAPIYTAETVANPTLTILETIKNFLPNSKFYQASSSEMFGSTTPPQDETSLFHPRSPYAVSKVFAYHAVVNYREAYDLFATNGILFNHESPRRGETFVTRKISRAVARIFRGHQKKLYLGNLDASRDWGYAPDYVEAMWKMLQHGDPQDFVIATGVSATVRDFVDTAFKVVGLNYLDYVEVKKEYLRPAEVESLCGSAHKAARLLNWYPTVYWQELVRIMVEADLNELDDLIKGSNFR